MSQESEGNLTRARAQQLIDESNERLCFIPAKGGDARDNSFSTLVLDGTLRDFVVCNQCSKAIPWEVHRDTETVIHQCEFRDGVHGNPVPEFYVKVSPRSYPEMEGVEQESTRDSSRMSARDINFLIKNSSDRVRLLPKMGKSFVWKLFSLIEVDGLRQDFVFCNRCNRVCRWKPTDGTNNLRAHVCRRHTMPSEMITELLSEPAGVVESREMVDQSEVGLSSSSRPLSKRDLQVLIDSCSPRVSLIPGKGKSQVWLRFYKVRVDGETTNFAMCKDCKAVVIWKSKDGTTGLRKHACKRNRFSKKVELEFSSGSSTMNVEYPRVECEDSDISPLTKEEVQMLVDESSERIHLVPGRGKSDVWMTFSMVEVDGRKIELALCNLCNALVTWKSKDGTNGLRKHSCRKIRIVSQLPERSPQCSSKTSSVVPHTEFEERMAVMCGMDLIPAGLISSPGFVNLIQYVYNLGAKNGLSVDAKELLPTEKSISRRVDEMAAMEKENIITELQSCSSVGLGIDIWNHGLTLKDFMTISMHYMLETEDSLIVKNRVVYTCEIESETEGFFREKLDIILKEFGVHTKNIYVIGNENILSRASVEMTRVHCAGSGINSTLRTVFDDLSVEEYPQLHILLQSCRKLVSSIRSIRDQNKLLEDEISLQPEHPRCWNATYSMLHSILVEMAKLEEALSDSDQVNPFHNIDRCLLEEVVKLLKPFDEATKLLVWSNTPTLPLVVPTKVKLQRCLEAKEGDSEIIKGLKVKLLRALDVKFHIEMVHCVATVLHPKMKGFVRQYLGEIMFDDTKEQIMTIMNEINRPETKKEPEEPPETKLQLEEDQSEFLSEVMRDYAAGESDDDEQGELSFYLNSKNTTRFGDPLTYWKQNASLCSNLFKVAKSVLAIPASGALCEMYTSEIGKKMVARRSCIGGDSISNVLIIHCAAKS